MTFADQLRSLRTDAHLTQQALADAAGVHRVDIAHYERGQRLPTLQTTHRLAQALGVSLSVFDGVTFPEQ